MTMKEEIPKWIKWRWEFLRRNDLYRQNYQSYLKMRKSKPPKENLEGYAHPIPYSLPSPVTPIERVFCYNTGLNLNYLPDPDKSFEEILGINNNSSDEEKKNRSKIASTMFALGTVEEKPPDTLAGRSGVLCYLVIDFRLVNSIRALTEEVRHRLETNYNSYLSRIKEEGKRKKQTYLVDYDLILRVGDMRTQGIKIREIAGTIDPQKFKDNKDSAIRIVHHLHKRYKELVENGYLLISRI